MLVRGVRRGVLVMGSSSSVSAVAAVVSGGDVPGLDVPGLDVSGVDVPEVDVSEPDGGVIDGVIDGLMSVVDSETAGYVVAVVGAGVVTLAGVVAVVVATGGGINVDAGVLH